MYKIIETDNYGGDYPDEKFVENLPRINSHKQASRICDAINDAAHAPYGELGGPRHYRVVDADYVLAPGFEP